jgi:uncharacterized protein
MDTDLFDQYAAIDVDTHVTEPPDLWSSRVAKKHRDLAPRIERVDGKDVWLVGGKPYIWPGFFSMAGFDGSMPIEYPATFDEIDPAMTDQNARLAHMDRQGVHAQVLYPNVGGFGSQVFLRLEDPELKLSCVRAYNDFLTEFASADPDRLLPITALPFWDLEATLKEVERTFEHGHRGILFPTQPQVFGQPSLTSSHWNPLWSMAQAAGLAINFHVASDGDWDPIEVLSNPGEMGKRAHFGFVSSIGFTGNLKGIGEVIFGGVCHRYPDLKFVSVESGVGYMPSMLETMDWQWQNSRVALDHPEYDMLPSEYFRRQIYACFWFERGPSFETALHSYPDNMMWETDFPHPTSQSPGPATPALAPREYAAQALKNMPDDIVGKVLHGNAARVYNLNTN